MRCTLDSDSLVKRSAEIVTLLSPIVPVGQRLACYPKSAYQEILLTPNLRDDLFNSSVGYKFPTKIPRLRASYLERWIATKGKRQHYGLERAYFHLFLRGENRQEQEKEILALHCDPNEPDTGTHYRYKAVPHIHMSTAEDPLQHSHISLCNDNFDEVLKSVQNLTATLRRAIVMVDCEVLAKY